jgi:DivIVA domain-containing protein
MGSIRVMEGTPQLLTDVKFTQLRKGGYDPEEVDNYLERINDAVAKLADNLREANDRAEAAQSQLADARRAQADVEAELERVRGGEIGTTSGGVSADEELAKVLVLAQRAADQVVEEANANAERTVADARAKAVNLVADAEQERERMLAKAHKKADTVAEERARTLNEQVSALSAAKADLEADVTALTTHLELERDRLRERIESVRTALDDPDGLRLAPAPELLDTPIPEIDLPTTEERPSPFAPLDDEPAADSGELGIDLTAPSVDDGALSGIDEGGSTIHLSTAGTETESTIEEDAHDDADEVASDAGDSSESHEADKADVALFDRAGDREPVVDPGPPTELFSHDEPLGPPDEEADAAMRAFFERDLDDPATTARGRFGRRR